MKPGPPLLIQCPHCAFHMSRRTLLSGNTFGARHWSDGKIEAPMLPDFPAITKCSSCNGVFWIEDATIQESNPESARPSDDEIRNLPAVSSITLEEMMFLTEDSAQLSAKRELFLRRKLLEMFNDRARNKQPLHTSSEEEECWYSNLLRLGELLQSTNELPFLQAELKRYSGDFAGCISLLDKISDSQYAHVKQLFYAACTAKEREVFELK